MYVRDSPEYQQRIMEESARPSTVELAPPSPGKSIGPDDVDKEHIITAWGETKSLYDWGNDPRCKVKKFYVSGRLRERWKPEDAMTIPYSYPDEYNKPRD